MREGTYRSHLEEAGGNMGQKGTDGAVAVGACRQEKGWFNQSTELVALQGLSITILTISIYFFIGRLHVNS